MADMYTSDGTPVTIVISPSRRREIESCNGSLSLTDGTTLYMQPAPQPAAHRPPAWDRILLGDDQ